MTGANFSGVGIAGLSYRNGILNSVTLRGGAGEDIFPISSLGTFSSGPIAQLLLSGSLEGADLEGTRLDQANFNGLNLSGVDFRGAILRKASFVGADLLDASFRQTDMSGADLSSTRMIGTNFEQARLTGCRVHGVSAWGLKLEGADQSDLVITNEDEPVITIDSIEVAQFVYLLLSNERIRNVIDTITSKMVLILGRFDNTRKPILDAIRAELRKHNYIPVLFDWDKPAHRDLTETVSTLAHMSRFIIADITEPRSVPQELQRIVPSLPSVPIQPLLQSSSHEYGMFEHFRRYPWVLDVYQYDDVDSLLGVLDQKIIKPAESKARLLEVSRGRP